MIYLLFGLVMVYAFRLLDRFTLHAVPELTPRTGVGYRVVALLTGTAAFLAWGLG